MNMRALPVAMCAFALAACGPAEEPPPDDESVLAGNLSAMCGEYARLFIGADGDEQITGTCYIRTSGNLSLFNSLAPPVYYGALIVEPVAGDIHVLDLQELVAVQGNLRIGPSMDLDEIDAQRLTMVSEQLLIQDNQVLVDVAMPSLSHVGRLFDVTNNPLLPQCEVGELRDQLSEAPETEGVFTGNCDDCC